MYHYIKGAARKLCLSASILEYIQEYLPKKLSKFKNKRVLTYYNSGYHIPMYMIWYTKTSIGWRIKSFPPFIPWIIQATEPRKLSLEARLIPRPNLTLNCWKICTNLALSYQDYFLGVLITALHLEPLWWHPHVRQWKWNKSSTCVQLL